MVLNLVGDMILSCHAQCVSLLGGYIVCCFLFIFHFSELQLILSFCLSLLSLIDSMHGYQDWREDFSQRKIDDIPKLTNNTLIYFQRTGNRKFVFSDCVTLPALVHLCQKTNTSNVYVTYAVRMDLNWMCSNILI